MLHFRSGTRPLSLVLLILLSLLMTFALLELAVRLVEHDNIVNKYVPDRTLGHKRQPNSEGIYKTREFSHDIKFNAGGWHDTEHTVTKPKDVFRIIVLGDSYVEGVQVSLEQTISRKLERLLNRHFKGTTRYEVINMGVSGYGTTQEFLLLKDIGLSFRPDLVILSFLTGNDIRNNSIFLDQTTRNWSEARRPYVELRGDFVNFHLPGPEGLKKNSRDGWRYWLIDHVRLAKFVHRKLSHIKPTASWMVEHGFLAKSAYLSTYGIPVDYQIYSSEKNDEWENAWAITEYLLREMKHLLNEKKIPFVVMILNNREQVYDEDWTKILDTYPAMKKKSWDLDIPDARIASILEKLNIDYLNLLPRFQMEAKYHPEKRLYYKIDGHWSIHGHELTAKVLYEFITSNLMYLE